MRDCKSWPICTASVVAESCLWWLPAVIPSRTAASSCSLRLAKACMPSSTVSFVTYKQHDSTYIKPYKVMAPPIFHISCKAARAKMHVTCNLCTCNYEMQEMHSCMTLLQCQHTRAAKRKQDALLTRRYTWTALVWPSLWHRSSAWRSI